MRFVRRAAMTLMEVLIVVTILSLISGVIGINIMWSVKEQRFRTEVALVVDSLRLAQDLMLILGTDVYVRMEVKDKKKEIEYWLDVTEGVPKDWKRIVEKTRRSLTEIHNITLDPLPLDNEPFALKFLSDGSIMSKGVFYMSTHDDIKTPGALTAAICLKGYPHPIVSVFDIKDPIKCEDPGDKDIEQRLTSITVQELTEDNEGRKTAPSGKESEGRKTDENQSS